MNNEEREDAEFKQYLEARWAEGIFAEFDARIFMGEIMEETYDFEDAVDRVWLAYTGRYTLTGYNNVHVSKLIAADALKDPGFLNDVELLLRAGVQNRILAFTDAMEEHID